MSSSSKACSKEDDKESLATASMKDGYDVAGSKDAAAASSDHKISCSEDKYVDNADTIDDKSEYMIEDNNDNNGSTSVPIVDVLSIEFEPNYVTDVSDPLRLAIRFSLDRDVIAAHWIVKLLVDSCDRRVIKVLGETKADDYTEGENEMEFSVAAIDVSGIPANTLLNSGLLMSALVVDGEEVSARPSALYTCASSH